MIVRGQVIEVLSVLILHCFTCYYYKCIASFCLVGRIVSCAFFQQAMRELDLDDYDNVRGPRPWEPETLLYAAKVKEDKLRKLEDRRKELATEAQ